MNLQSAAQIVVASIFGINLGIVGLPKRVSASPIFETSTIEIVKTSESDVSQSEQETVELETVEQNVIGQDTEQKEIEAQDTKKQDIKEQKEAAIAEIIEAIAADSAQLTDTDSADSAQPSTQLLPTQLLDQLLANALNANHAPLRPSAEALGEPVSISLETATSTELPATIDLAAVSQSFGPSFAPSFNIDPDTVPALRNALNSHNELTQLYAADTLWTLTSDANLILPTLISATESNQSETRELALLAIAQLGQEALPAIPILNDIITSASDRSDDRTRQLAQDALEIVSSENRPATVLGILAREVQKLGGIPALFRAISRLW
ncbi:MAG: HEAT repeat domain-containing protein [Cyanobacteria bacterium J06621_11]